MKSGDTDIKIPAYIITTIVKCDMFTVNNMLSSLINCVESLRGPTHVHVHLDSACCSSFLFLIFRGRQFTECGLSGQILCVPKLSTCDQITQDPRSELSPSLYCHCENVIPHWLPTCEPIGRYHNWRSNRGAGGGWEIYSAFKVHLTSRSSWTVWLHPQWHTESRDASLAINGKTEHFRLSCLFFLLSHFWICYTF